MSADQEERREEYDNFEDFGRAIAQQAYDEARRRNGGGDLTRPIEWEATVSVSPGSTWFCVRLLPILRICVRLN
jgi:hypothetical protein